MKDYTKYDFSAIVGAEVEIHYHAGEPLIVKLIHFNNESKLLVCVVLAKNAYHMPVGRIDHTHVSEIASINAKIKVEDMTIKQTRNLQNGKLTFNGNEVLDCTEWGWQK